MLTLTLLTFMDWILYFYINFIYLIYGLDIYKKNTDTLYLYFTLLDY